MDQEMMTKIQEAVMFYGLKFIVAILIFAIGRWVAKFLMKVLKNVMDKAKVDPTLTSFVSHLTYVVLMAFVVIAALNQLGVQTTSFVAIIGAAGLAIGLALQGSLANFAAGVMLIIFKPFGVGDFIEAGGTMGSVQEIQIFNTVLSHPDNRKIVVPNAQITGGIISNFSAIEKRRIELIFGISYADDMRKAKEVLLKLVTADERVLKDPAPMVAVKELGDSSVNLVCRPWVKPQDYWNVYFDVVEKGKLALEENGMTIPFPQRDVHVFNEK